MSEQHGLLVYMNSLTFTNSSILHMLWTARHEERSTSLFWLCLIVLCPVHFSSFQYISLLFGLKNIKTFHLNILSYLINLIILTDHTGNTMSYKLFEITPSDFSSCNVLVCRMPGSVVVVTAFLGCFFTALFERLADKHSVVSLVRSVATFKSTL